MRDAMTAERAHEDDGQRYDAEEALGANHQQRRKAASALRDVGCMMMALAFDGGCRAVELTSTGPSTSPPA